MNLTSLFISDGRWHQLEIKLLLNRLVLSGDFNRYHVETPFFDQVKTTSLKQVGGDGGELGFVGCLKGNYSGPTLK